MFRIVCDPSSGSIELYLTEIIHGGSQKLPNTKYTTNICEPPRIMSVKYSVGVIFNFMSFNFYTT